MKNTDAYELQDALFSRAYDQAIYEYQSWEIYRREQWLSFIKYGRDDLLDLAMALLSSGKRVRYPIAALDLAAYTLAKFGLDSDLVKVPMQGYTFNERTGDNDPFQLFTLNTRFGTTMMNRIHFTPHLLARCALFSDHDVSDYLHVLLASGVYSHDIVACAQRELQKIVVGACPYEIEAERQRKNDPDALRRAKEFFYEEKWPSEELGKEIERIFAIQQDIARTMQKINK